MGKGSDEPSAVHHNIFAAQKLRKLVPMYKNFRESAGTSTKKKKKKKKTRIMQKKADPIEALSLKLLGISWYQLLLTVVLQR